MLLPIYLNDHLAGATDAVSLGSWREAPLWVRAFVVAPAFGIAPPTRKADTRRR
jgi:hypothetical protein